MTYLPDVNVWIALYSPAHVHHVAALQWFDSTEERLVFCRVTQMGFLRLVTNRHVMHNNALTPAAAWGAYDDLLSIGYVAFVNEPPDLEASWRSGVTAERGGSAWTDAYLAAFAASGDLTLVTFDAQLARRSRGARLLK
jgi:uncharacterized protein